MIALKVNVTLDDDLMSRIDAYADENYMTRSGFVSLACTKYLQEQEAFRLVKGLSVAVRKISESGSADADTVRKLQELEKIANIMLGDVM